MAYDAARGQVVLFGGLPITGRAGNDSWVWDRFAMTYDAAHGQKSPSEQPVRTIRLKAWFTIPRAVKCSCSGESVQKSSY